MAAFVMLNVRGRRGLGFFVVVRQRCRLHVGERRPRGERLLETYEELAYAIREA